MIVQILEIAAEAEVGMKKFKKRNILVHRQNQQNQFIFIMKNSFIKKCTKKVPTKTKDSKKGMYSFK